MQKIALATQGVCLSLCFVALATQASPAAAAIELGPSYDLPMQQNRDHNLAASAAAVGDINGDGRVDIAFLAQGFGSDSVSDDLIALVFEQQPDGAMRQTLQFPMAAPGIPYYNMFAIALGDLDGDGKTEMLLNEPSPGIAILKRGANGAFEKVASLPGYFLAEELQIDDMNGDGLEDIVAFSSASGLAIYPGKGGFSFDRPVAVQTLNSAHVAYEDVNGDGIRDAIGTSLDYDGIGINYGLSPKPQDAVGGARKRFGFFRAPIHLDRIPSDNAGAGRYHGQTKPVIFTITVEGEMQGENTIALWQTLTVYAQDDAKGWQQIYKKRYEDLGSVMRAPFRVFDVNQDGLDDIVVFHEEHLEILLQDADGFSAPVVPLDTQPGYVGPPRYGSTHIADFNGDGCPDFGYLSRSYTIHYRLDCPSASRMRASELPASSRASRLPPRHRVRGSRRR